MWHILRRQYGKLNIFELNKLKYSDIVLTVTTTSPAVISTYVGDNITPMAVSILYNDSFYHAQETDNCDLSPYITENSVGLVRVGALPSIDRPITLRLLYI